MDRELTQKSKRLSFLLRHDEEYEFDQNGWREVRDLIDNHGFSRDELEAIVINNDKRRYEFNEDKNKIRARQGHSINVDVELKENKPPTFLFHGTAEQFISSILSNGLLPMTRQHVHLSTNYDTAVTVGSRHGQVIVIKVDAERMYNDGVKFFLSNNGVWLTHKVPVEYLEVLESTNTKKG